MFEHDPLLAAISALLAALTLSCSTQVAASTRDSACLDASSTQVMPAPGP